MDDAQVEQEVVERGLTAPRVTKEHIDRLMDHVIYMTHQPDGTTTTLVHAFLNGTFKLATGEAACIDPANFRADLGERMALAKAQAAARDKLWELEGYALFRKQLGISAPY